MKPLSSTYVHGWDYQFKVQAPVAYATGGQWHKLSMISTITNYGLARGMIIDGAFDSDKFIEFLQALIKDAGKKVFLIKVWFARYRKQIEVFYLPSYSPELNPDERLNLISSTLWALGFRCAPKISCAKQPRQHMSMLQNNLQRVRSYFDDPKIKYAAAYNF